MDETERLNDLIARCEKASGADRELDNAIAECIWPGCHIAPHCLGDEPIMWHAPEPYRKKPVPNFTESLDAAMTLVPDHISFELAWSAAGEGACRRARLWDWRRSPMALDPDNNWEATAKTLPLALVIAALRARLPQPAKES